LKLADDGPPTFGRLVHASSRPLHEAVRDIRAKHGILELCKRPDLAAQITLQPVEILDVDAAIIFADLLLPVEPMGLKLRFAAARDRLSTILFAPPAISTASPFRTPTIWVTSGKASNSSPRLWLGGSR